MPSEVAPAATAVSAYSICSSLPDGEKVVSEKEYAESPMAQLCCDRSTAKPVHGTTLQPARASCDLSRLSRNQRV